MARNFIGLVIISCTLYGAVTWGNDKVLQDCMDCHGEDGVSTEPDVPVIAGFSAQYTIDSLKAYIDGDRPATESKYRSGDTSRAPTDMAKIAKQLSEEEIKKIAAHFAAKKFVPRQQAFDADKAAKGEKIHNRSCKKCHEDGGSSPDDDAGILAGQWMDYLHHAFKEYASGERWQPKKMKPKMEELDEADVDALIHYYASLQ